MRKTQLWLAAVLCLFVAGCKKKDASAGKGPGGMSFQVVGVAARQQPVTESLSLVGTIAPHEMVEIKCEPGGTVEEVLFAEGQEVKKGQLLIRLDERKLAAAVAEADANYQL